VCYRLWSEAQHDQLAAHGSAEILQADLAGLALQLARWGVTPEQLRWLDQPPAAAFAQAQDLLARLSAFRPGSRDTLSEHGQAMAELPAHPRIAHLLLRGQDLGLAQMACDVAALLGERDILRGGGADLHSRLALVSGESKAARGGQGVCSVLVSWPGNTVACCVARPVHRSPTRTTRAGWAPAGAGLPDRVAQQRRAGGAEYRLANGRAALFGEADALMKCPGW
jgi:ATP-dependent helicase HrpB